jgi:hypothetical protein
MNIYKCPECGDNVTKRKSYLYKGNRVCKIHNLKDEAPIKKPQEPNEVPPHYIDSSEYLWQDDHCWCCSTTGFHIKDCWEYILKACPAESIEELLDKASLRSTRPLMTIVGISRGDTRRVIKKLRAEAYMSGSIQMCAQCIINGNDSPTFLLSAKANLTDEDMKIIQALPFDIEDFEKYMETI